MHGAPLILYNSLTRASEPFAPIDPANVRIYSCGPTVYHYAHIGNLRAYVFTDTLSRTIAWKGLAAHPRHQHHRRRPPDVRRRCRRRQDGGAREETGQDIWAIAAHYTRAFKRNLSDLSIREPSRFPLATDHVAGMIDFAAAIAERHCYRLDSGLYFDVSTVPDYGRLARHREDEGEGRIDPVA
ncbi:MAG: cysteine--tRNA ligase, partial [Sphingomonas taxi]